MPDQSKILLHMPSGTAVCALIGSSSTNLPELLLSSASALTASTFGYDAFTFEAELAGDWDATYVSLKRNSCSGTSASHTTTCRLSCH
jgi:hypothetical protein